MRQLVTNFVIFYVSVQIKKLTNLNMNKYEVVSRVLEVKVEIFNFSLATGLNPSLTKRWIF